MKIKIKTFSLLIVAGLMLGLCINQASKTDGSNPSNIDPYQLPVISYDAFLLLNPVDLETIEDYCTHIVRGYLLNDAKTSLTYHEEDSINFGQVSSFYTLSTLVVTEVYKGDVAVGDKLPLKEQYYYENIDGKLTLITIEGYVPIEPNKEYVFLIKCRGEEMTLPGVYDLSFFTKSRYPVVDDVSKLSSRSNRELRISDKITKGSRTYDTYISIYTDVAQKYMNK